jgi:hypothetical protein
MVVLSLHFGGLLGGRWICQSSELQVPLLLANPDVKLLVLCCQARMMLTTVSGQYKTPQEGKARYNQIIRELKEPERQLRSRE